MSVSDVGFIAALEEAELGLKEGGVPIGACLVSKEGRILGRGHNLRVQKGSPTLHGEISALENAGRLPATAYDGATMYTTVSPCDMCTGACLLYKIKRVVVGEIYSMDAINYLKKRGVDVVVLNDERCTQMMLEFKLMKPDVWNEDIGES